MASKLLNVLNKIESDRKYLIDIANGLGYSIQNNASFRDIEQAIIPIPQEPTEIPTFDIPQELINIEDWVRPSEWPDCHQILLDEPAIVSGNATYVPYLIIMITNRDVATTIYPSRTGWYNKTGEDSIQWDRIKTSDGSIYTTNNQTITHTWDSSKDIVVTDGSFPGTYRYIIYYARLNNNAYYSLKGIGNLPAVEIIQDASRCTQTNPYAPITHFANQEDTLLNIEVFNAGNDPSLYFSDQYSRCFQSLSNLRNLDFHDVQGHIVLAYDYNSTFHLAHKLRYIDLSNFTVNYGAGNKSAIGFDLATCYSLVSFKAPYHQVTNNRTAGPVIKLGYNPYLRNIEITGDEDLSTSTLEFSSEIEDHNRTYVPLDINVIGRFVCNSAYLPVNWGNHNYITHLYYADTSYPITSTQYPYFYDHSGPLCFRDVLDITNVLVYCNRTNPYSIFKDSTSSHPLIYSGENYGIPAYQHAVMLLPQNMCTRFTINGRMDHANMLRIFNNLLDLNTVTDPIYNAEIKISRTTYDILNPEDIAIATAKGWTVTRS